LGEHGYHYSLSVICYLFNIKFVLLQRLIDI
jgi:hypothetical protein